MATRPKRRRKVQSPSTDIQPSTSTNQAVEDLVRACMSSITPIIETTCRRVIEEKLSTAEIPVPQTIASSDPPPVVPTTDQSTSAEASPTLLQEMTATDLNDCFALTEIGSLKNDQMIGICQLGVDTSSIIENCKTYCLHAYDSRCFGVIHDVRESYCIPYMYTASTSRSRCYKGASHFFHIAIFIYHAVPYMPVAPKPFYEWCQDIFGPYVWKTVPRLLDGGIAEDPSQSFTEHTASLCAMKCQLRQLCQLFRCNTLTAECDLYDGIGFRRISNVTGNQFFQKMPTSCETGRDEWFPEYQNCIWIPMYAYPYEEAKNKCEAVGKVMMGTENYQKVMHLMNVTNAKSTHVYSRHLGNNTYQWIDGTMIPASQWCPGQPAENTGCLGVQNDLDSACPQGGLYEIPCSFSNRFFCVEKNKNTVRRWVDKA